MAQVAMETVRTIFASQDLPLSNETTFASMLISSAKSTIFSVVGNAQQICRNSKRQRLSVSDINLALESLEMEPLFGYSSDSAPDLVKVEDYGPPSIFAYKDTPRQVESYGRGELPPYPLLPHYEINWLCVNGVTHEAEEAAEAVIEKQDVVQLKTTQKRQQAQDSDASIVSSKHQLSYTHQKFFRETRVRLLSGDKEKMEKMFARLSTRNCLSTLVPYFIRFSMVQFRDNQNDWSTLYASLCTARALVQNTSLKYVECYMQSFISIALSFLLSPTLLKNNAHEFIKMEELAAEYLIVITDRLQNPYPMVQPHITNQLLSVLLNKESSIHEKYGSLVGVCAFGPETVASFILPNVNEIISDLMQGPMKSGDRDTRLIASTMYDTILNAVGLCLHSDTAKSFHLGIPQVAPKTANNMEKIIDVFGPQLLQFYVDDSVKIHL